MSEGALGDLSEVLDEACEAFPRAARGKNSGENQQLMCHEQSEVGFMTFFFSTNPFHASTPGEGALASTRGAPESAPLRCRR
jgi:hypothetical protein